MHLLIVGGSPNHLGGVEAFCERSKEALERKVGWRVTRLTTGTAYLTLKRLPVLVSGLAALVLARRERPDIVWLQYVTLPDLLYLMLAKLLGMKVMVTPHLGSNWRSQSNPFLRALSGWMLSFANRVALISKTQELEINLPTTLPRSLIRNFLPPAILSAEPTDPAPGPRVLQLIHSGRLSEGKGTFLFVEVCERLRAAGTPFYARITGGSDPETLNRLNQMIHERQLQDQIAVLGRVPEDDLLDLLRNSDVLIHLSKIDSYPLIVLESIACRIFPVCMELAGARDMIQTYCGKIVAEDGAAAETAAFLSGGEIEEIRSVSQSYSLRVRADYSWDLCAEAVKSALLLV